VAERAAITETEFKTQVDEALKLADVLERDLPALAKELQTGQSPDRIRASIAQMKDVLSSLKYSARGEVKLLPEFASGLRELGDGRTFVFEDPGNEPPGLQRLLSDYQKRGYTVRKLPGGSYEVLNASGEITTHILPVSPEAARYLPDYLDFVARGTKTQEGLARVRAQSAAPELAYHLARAARRFGAGPVRRILQIIAGGDAPPSDKAFRGLNNFLRLAGNPRVANRIITIVEERTPYYFTQLLEQIADWDAAAVNGLGTIYQVRPQTTGTEIGRFFDGFAPNEVKNILRDINQLAPNAEPVGLRRVIDQLVVEFVVPARSRPGAVSASPAQKGGRGTLAAAVALLPLFPGKRIGFEVAALTPEGVLRIQDIVIIDPATGEHIFGFEVKEVTSAFLGRRAPGQLAADIARDAEARARAADLGVTRQPYDTFRWLIRRAEIQAQAISRLQGRGTRDPSPQQIDTEMRAMVRDNLKEALEQPEVRGLTNFAEYRRLFEQSLPFVDFF
jgi:hypothetical protein